MHSIRIFSIQATLHMPIILTCFVFHCQKFDLVAGKSGSPDPQHASDPPPLLALQGRRPSPQVRPLHPHGEQGQARPDAA